MKKLVMLLMGVFLIASCSSFGTFTSLLEQKPIDGFVSQEEEGTDIIDNSNSVVVETIIEKEEPIKSNDSKYSHNFSVSPEGLNIDITGYEELFSLIDSGEYEKAKEYITNENISKETLSFFLIASPEIIPDNESDVLSQIDKNNWLFDRLQGFYYLSSEDLISVMSKYEQRLRFLLDCGVDIYMLDTSSQGYNFVDKVISKFAVKQHYSYNYYSYNDNTSSYSELWYVISRQLEVLIEQYGELDSEYDLIHYLNIAGGNNLLRDDFTPYLISTLTDALGINPEYENLISRYLSLIGKGSKYGDEWQQLYIKTVDSLYKQGHKFSLRLVDSCAKAISEYIEGTKPSFSTEIYDGLLISLYQMGYDFSTDSYSLLFSALDSWHFSNEELQYVILNSDSLNARNDKSETLLMHAVAYQKDPTLMNILLDNGADINKKMRDNTTALMFAVKEFAPISNIIALIDRGIDVNAVNNDGYNAISILFKDRNPSKPWNETFGDNEIYNFTKSYLCPLLTVLIDSGISLDSYDKYNWNITGFIARSNKDAFFSDEKVFQLLYDSGMDMTAKCQNRSIEDILKSGNVKYFDFLKDKGLI